MSEIPKCPNCSKPMQKFGSVNGKWACADVDCFAVRNFPQSDKSEVKVKDKRRDKIGVMRVMAVAEGYVMVRRPGVMPFVKSVKDWLKDTEPMEEENET